MEMILTFAIWFVLIMLGIHVGYALIMASVFFFVVSATLGRVCHKLRILFF